MNAPLPAMSRTPTPASAGHEPPVAAATAGARRRRSPPMSSASAAADDRVSGPKTWPSLIWAMNTPNRPIVDAGEEREPEARRSAALVATRETRTTATIASPIPTRTSAVGPALEDDPGHDRDERRDDAGDRRHDPHPPDRQAPVERADPDPAGEPADDAPADVGGRRHGPRRGRPPGRARPPCRRAARRGRRRTAASGGRAGRRRSRRFPRSTADDEPEDDGRRVAGSGVRQGRRPPAGGVVDGGRAEQLDDRVGDRVVAIGGRQVDDLEVGRDRP